MASMNVPLLYRHILARSATAAQQLYLAATLVPCDHAEGVTVQLQKAAQKFPSIKRQALIADIKLDFRENKVINIAVC